MKTFCKKPTVHDLFSLQRWLPPILRCVFSLCSVLPWAQHSPQLQFSSRSFPFPAYPASILDLSMPRSTIASECLACGTTFEGDGMFKRNGTRAAVCRCCSTIGPFESEQNPTASRGKCVVSTGCAMSSIQDTRSRKTNAIVNPVPSRNESVIYGSR